MRTVEPIEPIRPVRAVRRITLRRVPSFKQLRMWLVFARQKAKDGPAHSAVAPSESPAPSEREEETNIAADYLHADHLHIDKRA